MFRRLRIFLKNYFHDLTNSNLLNYSAQLSYGLMLAFLPMLMLLNFAIQFLRNNINIKQEIYHFIASTFPSEISALVLPTLSANDYNPLVNIHSFIANFTLIAFIFYASMRLVRALMIITTGLMEEKETRNIVLLWLLAFRNLIFILIGLVLIFGIWLEFQIITTEYLLVALPQTQILANVFDFLSYLFLIVMLFLLLNWCLSRFPATRIKFSAALPGTLMVFIGWGALALGSHYVSKFLDYEGWTEIASQGLTILITVYLISLILLTGVIFNKALLKTHERGYYQLNKRYE